MNKWIDVNKEEAKRIMFSGEPFNVFGIYRKLELTSVLEYDFQIGRFYDVLDRGWSDPEFKPKKVMPLPKPPKTIDR